MALFQSRNKMSANKTNNQAQMLMLLNHVTNLENQLGQVRNAPQNQTMGVDSSNLLNIMSQLKSLQGKIPTTNGRKRKEVPVTPFPNRGMSSFPNLGMNSVPNLGMNLAGLMASMNGNNILDRTACIWVTGLPEEYQDADKLLNIFGNFGNVRRIKFTEKKPDGALIEMDDPRSAWKCRSCMDKQKIGGQEISVAPSKLEGAFIKKEDTKSKDVRQAKENWRFRKDSKFMKIVMKRLRKLTSRIIVSNLPEGKLSDLNKYIIEAGYTVKSIEEVSRRTDDKKPKPSTGYTVATVELSSTEEAISAVAKLHNAWPKDFGAKKADPFGNARGLVFSFTGPKLEKSKA